MLFPLNLDVQCGIYIYDYKWQKTVNCFFRSTTLTMKEDLHIISVYMYIGWVFLSIKCFKVDLTHLSFLTCLFWPFKNVCLCVDGKKLQTRMQNSLIGNVWFVCAVRERWDSSRYYPVQICSGWTCRLSKWKRGAEGESLSIGVGLSFDGGLMVNAELQTRSAATALFSGHSSRHTLTHTALHPDYKKLLISVTLVY